MTFSPAISATPSFATDPPQTPQQLTPIPSQTSLPTQTSIELPNGKRSLWYSSSQFRHWRFSVQRLKRMREDMNKSAVAVIRKALSAEEVMLENGVGDVEKVQFLDANDEHALVKLYVSKIPQLCAHFRLDEEVEATAMTFLKRFYLKNTVMDWHPKNVMLTCIFLAAKTTNQSISIEHFTSRIPNTKPNDVLELEFLLAQSLNFEFAVWSAHRALWGIWLDLQTLPDSRPEAIKDIYNAAIDHVRLSRLTDAEFIYAPSQIALGSLYLASSELAEKYLKAKGFSVTAAPASGAADEALSVVKECAEVISQEEEKGQIDLAFVKDVDRRLRICKNPERIVGTAAWKKKQAELEAAAIAAKQAKKKARRSGSGSGESSGIEGTMEVDVFGGDLIQPKEVSSASANPFLVAET